MEASKGHFGIININESLVASNLNLWKPKVATNSFFHLTCIFTKNHNKQNLINWYIYRTFNIIRILISIWRCMEVREKRKAKQKQILKHFVSIVFSINLPISQGITELEISFFLGLQILDRFFIFMISSFKRCNLLSSSFSSPVHWEYTGTDLLIQMGIYIIKSFTC